MPSASTEQPSFAPRCLSLDLETDPSTGRILKIGALRPDTGKFLHFKGSFNLVSALRDVDVLGDGASFVLGHNVVRHDLNILRAAAPELALLKLPVVDTLVLSPLAFPRNPYHQLVKDYKLLKLAVNDPLADAQRAVALFGDQRDALLAEQPSIVRSYHFLLVPRDASSGLGGLDHFFKTLTKDARPSLIYVRNNIAEILADKVCKHGLAKLLIELESEVDHLSIAYFLAWVRVAGENSIIPPWVRIEYPETARLARELRATPCGDAQCNYCREQHDSRRWLKQWFGYDDFRFESEGKSLQTDIVASTLAGQSQLGILPTGGGKSLCYQLPALMRFQQTGALTIVVSPLQALMKDQVDTLIRRDVSCAATINGLLSMPERKQVLDGIRLGNVGILLVSPEQVRNKGFRAAILHREIAAWVFDEAHCLSKWGHDFRSDYLYVARFIRERHDKDLPVITCLTATAKPDVIEDIAAHFRQKLGLELVRHLGSTERKNLNFAIVPTRDTTKPGQVQQLLTDYFGEVGNESSVGQLKPGCAIVYCSRQKGTEELAQFLVDMGWSAAAFHGGMLPDKKKDTQQKFIVGELKVIVATNAFGMGIDKPDVRLVIHADIPGSLENYIQEAGRAGRDQATAFCVLLYDSTDADRQFSLSSRSNLTINDIKQLLKALRRRKPDADGNVVITTDELLATEGLAVDFELDDRNRDTKVKASLAWLETAGLLERNENRSQVFPSSLRFKHIDEARKKLANASYSLERQGQLIALLQAILQAEPTQGLTTDELCMATGLGLRDLRKAFDDLEALGLLENDSSYAVFLRVGVKGASKNTLVRISEIEVNLLSILRTEAPDAHGALGGVNLNLRRVIQALKDAGIVGELKQHVVRLLKSFAADGRGLPDGRESLKLRRLDVDNYSVAVQRSWDEIEELSNRRRACAQVVLSAFLATLPSGAKGLDICATLTEGAIKKALRNDIEIASQNLDYTDAVQTALMYLHDHGVLTLTQGLSIFRNAMTLRLNSEAKESSGRALQFDAHDYQPLADHYEQKVSQIHVMIRYAEIGLEKISASLALTADYFTLSREGFLKRYFHQDKEMLERATTQESWHRIRDGLSPLQAKLVTEKRPTNRLVLAGPGSGKTRLIVHRAAFLVRVMRETPSSILVVTFNRHAAQDIRRRLRDLIDTDAFGIAAYTYHGLAMRLTGTSLAARNADTPIDFDAMLTEATRMLEGEGAEEFGDEPDALRDRMLGGFRWLLVDEYQDINAGQYDFLSALAGRTLSDSSRKLTLMAVGDDDQNIYEFTGAQVEFIRRFEADYKAKTDYLVENFRSTRHIIDAANALIKPHPDRLKVDHPIVIDKDRRKDDAGGVWTRKDSGVSQGRVQVLPVGSDPHGHTQAWLAIQELQRLAATAPRWDWSRVAIIASQWSVLNPMRAACELTGIAAHFAGGRDKSFPAWRLREVSVLMDCLRQRLTKVLTARELRTIANNLRDNALLTSGFRLIEQWCDSVMLESGAFDRPVSALLDDLYEFCSEQNRDSAEGITLTTAHGAKGLEFDHVIVLSGGWNRSNQSSPAERRLYYVAMTRARETLTLCTDCRKDFAAELVSNSSNPAIFRRETPLVGDLPVSLSRCYRTLGMSDVDIGFGGRSKSNTPRTALAQLNVGDPLRLEKATDFWEIKSLDGTTVGRTSRAFQMPNGEIADICIAAIVRWRKCDVAPEYLERIAVDQWEVVLPEFVIK